MARYCIISSYQSTWWDWVGGSRPFFWRWPENCWLTSLDGHTNFVKIKFTENLKSRSLFLSEFRDRIRVKLNSVRDKRYIRLNDKVKSFTNFFFDAKTMKITDSVELIDKIRIVYDAISQGLTSLCEILGFLFLLLNRNFVL